MSPNNTDVTGSSLAAYSEREFPLLPDPDVLPKNLTEREQWLVAQYYGDDSEDDKRPMAPTSYKDYSSLMSCADAIECADSLQSDPRVQPDGDTIVGISLTSSDQLLGWDLDKIRDPLVGDDSIPPEVWEIVREVGGFWNVSISGEGLRGFCIVDDNLAETMDDRPSKSSLAIDPIIDGKDPMIEAYTEKRYLTVSGAPPLSDLDEDAVFDSLKYSNGAESVVEEYLPLDQNSQSTREEGSRIGDQSPTEEVETEQSDGLDAGSNNSNSEMTNQFAQNYSHGGTGSGRGASATGASPDTVDQVVQTALKKGDSNFERLWHGEDIENDDSASDFLLLKKLAFWTQKNPQLIGEAFRQSGRYDCRDHLDYPKFDSDRHGEPGKTWAESEIPKAIDRQPDEFSGRYLDNE